MASHAAISYLTYMYSLTDVYLLIFDLTNTHSLAYNFTDTYSHTVKLMCIHLPLI